MAYDQHHELVQSINARRSERYVCTTCFEPLILKRGRLKVAHFAHLKQSKCESVSEGETTAHLLGKQQLGAFFSGAFPSLRLEVYLGAIQQRPDLLLNPNLAIEFQCSPISFQRLAQRLAGYKKLAIKSVWLLGPPYLKRRFSLKTLQQFMRYHKQWGCFLIYWDPSVACLTIYHHIRVVAGRTVGQQFRIRRLADLIPFDHRRYEPSLITPQQRRMRIIKQNRQLQRRILTASKRFRSMQGFCYQHHVNYAGYPIELDLDEFDVPVLGRRITDFKIILVLLLRDSNGRLRIDRLIEAALNQLGGAPSFLMLSQSVLMNLLQSVLRRLQQRKVVSIQVGWVELRAPLVWYATHEQKIAALQQCGK